jgi:hypothetical protein
MSYGHAERTLATIRLLEAETTAFLDGQDQLHPEEEKWLRDTAQSASRRLEAARQVPRQRESRWD